MGEIHANIGTDSNFVIPRTEEVDDFPATSPLYPLPTIFKNTALLLQEFESKRSPWTQESIRWMRHVSSLVAANIVELQREDFILNVVTQKKDYQRQINHSMERTNRLIRLQHDIISIWNTFLESLPQRQELWQGDNETIEDHALVEGDLHVRLLLNVRSHCISNIFPFRWKACNLRLQRS